MHSRQPQHDPHQLLTPERLAAAGLLSGQLPLIRQWRIMKRGGARVIYYWAVRKDLILLLYAYPQNMVADLSRKQGAQLAKVVKEEFSE